ncbi:MAG: reductive dehalogenase domain-containing protein [Alphaproteobacteria bacterium]
MSNRKTPVWQPPPEITALFPETSGNAVNGLGERAPRPPRYVMWTRPDRIAHGRVQQHVNDSYESHPRLTGAFSGPERRAKPAPVAPERRDDTPENWTRRVKEFARAHEADLVGVARIDPLWVFEGAKAHGPFVVVLGVAMEHAKLAKAPAVDSPEEVARQYNRGTRAAKALADFIRGQGYEAEGHGGPGAGPLQLVPAAIAAGLGQLGKHGSVINRQLGSSFRLAGVLTDLPLAPDSFDDIGAEEFCASCQVCANACPPAAIGDAKQWVRGAEKWYVDFDKCMPYFASTWGCGICIAACPWSKPGTAPRLAEKMLKRRGAKA